MPDFKLRTEEIKDDEILALFVENEVDREIVNAFKSSNPVILEGSRGTGKSFLMKVADVELMQDFERLRILPVYLSFNSSSLVYSNDPLRFRHWMLAKLIKQILKELRKKGLVISPHASSLITNTHRSVTHAEQLLEEIVERYENSYKTTNVEVDVAVLPDVNDLKDAMEDICETLSLQRICVFFDEAAHVFRPEQQRQFFTLFRDLRSPYISCNAAVYPGVTHYGPAFEMEHDAIFRRIERDLLEADYLDTMVQMVNKQLSEAEKKVFEQRKAELATLAFCAGGNPRILFRTLNSRKTINSTETENVIKDFYRSRIWGEHTALGEKYSGHKVIIDWGRNFLEETVIPAVRKINNGKEEDISHGSIFFWIHKDSPEVVKEAMRLLCYSSIVRKLDDGVRATRAAIGARYEIKYGCIVALDANPQKYSTQLRPSLSIKKFAEFGANHRAYKTIAHLGSTNEQDIQFLDAVKRQLQESITVLQLTDWQKQRLEEIGVTTIESLLSQTEEDLISQIKLVGEVRARRMKNAATAAFLEYLSG